ncbi:hypothetical protein ACOMHN_057074 [Nucella lapillus]
MKSTAFGAIFAVIYLMVVVVRAQTDPRCKNIVMKVMTCFSTHGLTMDLPPGPENVMKIFQQLQQMEVSTYCAKLESAKRAMACGMPFLRQCLDVLYMGGIVPDIRRVHQGMDAFCGRKDVSEFDSKCLRNQMVSILHCGQNVTQRMMKDRDHVLTLNESICLTTDINYDCYKLHLQKCNPTTQDVYEDAMNKYFVPPPCVNKPPGRPGRKSYTMPHTSASASGLSVGFSIIPLLAIQLLFRP